MTRELSSEGLKHLKQFEGLRLAAYRDSGGVWTIGWGHTRGVKEGDTCTEEQAELWLLEDAQIAVNCVNRRVYTDLTQFMFDAMVSFVFNVGCGAFTKSTLLVLLNGGFYKSATDELPRWNKVKGKVVDVLTNRRQKEQELFWRKEL